MDAISRRELVCQCAAERSAADDRDEGHQNSWLILLPLSRFPLLDLAEDWDAHTEVRIVAVIDRRSGPAVDRTILMCMPSAPDPADLAGRVSLVTGGSRGIGFAIAQALLDAGSQVAITGRDKAKLEDARTHLGGGDRKRSER